MIAGIKQLLVGLRSHDRSVVLDAAHRLRALDRLQVIKGLRSRLSHEVSEVRCMAAEALMKVCGSEGLQFILRLLADQDSTVRWCAAGISHDFSDVRAVPDLIRVVTGDPEADVRLVAAQALGRIGDATALGALRTVAEHDLGEDYEGRKVAAAAAEAIEQIQSLKRVS